MLDYSELKPGVCFTLDGQPYVVTEFNFMRMQMRKPVAQTKIRNLITGKTVERNFQHTDKFEEAEIEKKPIKYLYNSKNEFWFCEEKDPSKRFKLNADIASACADFIKANTLVNALVYNEQTIGVELPVKVELKVVEAPPSIKGNTAQGGTKQVKLETGYMLNVPLFINEDDIIRVNTQTREYVERANK